MELFLFLTPICIILIVSAVLAYHKGFKEGVLGSCAFFAIALFATVIVMAQLLHHRNYLPQPLEIVLLLWGIALFMLRFVVRFFKWWCNEKVSRDEPPCTGCAYGRK